VTCTYWSLDQLADAAECRASDGIRRNRENSPSWAGGTFGDSLTLARSGWAEELSEALSIAQDAVELCERNHEVLKVTEPVYDVSGDSVDIGRYLSGEPECMVDFPLQPTSDVGRVITLCASVGYSAAIDADVIRRRGQVIVAFALALSQLGHNVECWADTSGSRGDRKFHVRTLVKAADDTLDPARIMFAYANPGMLRNLSFAIYDQFPGEFRQAFGPNTGRGMPIAPKQDHPEGTVYLPELLSGTNVPDAHEQLRELLGQVGLLASDNA
jgi:hypothetical protein